MYFYHDGENEVGPFGADKLCKLESTGLIGPGTLVRSVDSSSWVSFSQLDLPSALKDAVNKKDEVKALHEIESPFKPDQENLDVIDKSIERDLNNSEAASKKTKVDYSSSDWIAFPPTPWRRYGARMLDTTLNGAIAFFLFGVAFYAIAPAAADEFFLIFEGESARIYDVIMTAIAASLLGGLLIGVSGFTLGKWIFGIKVTRVDEKKLGIGAGLSRDFAVLLKGLGLGIPIVAIFTMWVSYKRLNEKNSTSWDEGQYIVWHRPSGSSQYILNFIGILLIILVVVGVSALGAL